jgi:formylglycine-generating enzyme required for sulfatase activity
VESTWTPPTEIGEFRLERVLGHGACGDVWLARDTLLERPVALKIARAVESQEGRLRFLVEARAVARLHHPNLITVHHAGELMGRPFLVTELLSGTSLADLARPVPPERVLAIGIDIARGLAAAHRAGVLHCDIKPANAFLCDSGVAKLLDFGLAKLVEGVDALAATIATSSARAAAAAPDGGLEATMPASLPGTPLYMSPESWRGEPATQRADVYSLGATLYHLLSGRPPHSGGSFAELGRRVGTELPPTLAAIAAAVPAALAGLVMRCLAREPGARPTADELRDALETIAAAPITAPPEDEPDPQGNPYRGLLAFGPEQRALFFGREREIGAVLEELRAAPFVLVTGPSGAGKSSLVRAGVVPRVQAGALGSARWSVVTMTPGRRPLEALAQAVAPVLAQAEEAVAGRLAASPAWLAEEVRTRGRGEPMLFVIDQLEELATLSEEQERATFTAALVEVLQAAPVARVVATLRSDFLGRLAELGALRAEALRAPIVLGPLSAEGLRQAIVEPARRRGFAVEPELCARLVAGGERGSLPLLEFALGALWERRDLDTRTLTAAALETLGGLGGALAAHADGVLDRLPAAQQAEARRLLMAMTTVEGTRARREAQDLLGDSTGARSALEALVEGRLVVAAAGEDGAVYEVAHDTLLTDWPALRGWLAEEAGARELLDRLARAAVEWDRLGRGEAGRLGPRQLRELEALGGRGQGAREEAFVRASRAAVRRARRLRRVLVLGVPLALLAVIGTVWGASIQRRRAAIGGVVAGARAQHVRAEVIAGTAEALRARAFAQFEQDDLGPAERTWKQALAKADEADAARREVGAVVDRALALDPRDRAARALQADVTFARLLAAERAQKPALAATLRSQLGLHDDGTRAARLRAPGRVRVESEPPGAAMTLARYVEDAAGRLVESDPAPLAAATLTELVAGSYLVLAEAPGRSATRYPFALKRGEERRLRIVLPPADRIPDGMLYVPAGRFLYGSGDDEDTRGFLTHQPEHEVELPAFLIARTEVTYGDYLTFLRALPEAERSAHLPGGLTFAADRVTVQIGDLTVGEDRPYCLPGRPCVELSRLPVDRVNRADGEAYAAWLAASGRLPGARLCTDREWERAARGADDRRYPHGNQPPAPPDACTLFTYGRDRSRAGPCAVGTHPLSRSPFGVEDAVGSVAEWTSHSPDAAVPAMGILRGYGWSEDDLVLRVTNRGLVGHSARWRLRGLRLCAGPPAAR